MAGKTEIEAIEDVVEGQQEGKKKRPSVLVIVGIVLVLLILIGVSAGAIWHFWQKSAAEEKKQQSVLQTAAIGPVWPMESIIVNLADGGGERYLKVAMQLEVASPEATKELDLVKPKIRDTVIDLLSSKTYADLADNAGKQRLRDEIILRANSVLTQGKVTKVYFTEFIIQ